MTFLNPSSKSPRQHFIDALELRPPVGRVPHFELVFFLTMEALGRVHPAHRWFDQWDQMSRQERQLQIQDMADTYLAIAERYQHSAIFILPARWNCDYVEGIEAIAKAIRDRSGDRYFLVCHGDPTFGIPNGNEMEGFVYRLADEPEAVHAEARKRVARSIEEAGRFRRGGLLDGFILCSDYCMNEGPFLSPELFSQFVTPYLVQTVTAYRELGFYVIKHTDGNINPIIDQLLSAKPHGLHSLDPQGRVNLRAIKERYGRQVCLLGNVNCGLLQTGTAEEAAEDCRRALRDGMPGGGFIFSTSNCIYTGLDLERYHLMHRIWQQEGIYPV